MTTKRNDWRSRETVQWGHPELKNVSKVSSHTEDQTYIQTSTTPDKQGLIHTQPSALLRWEDDGGQTS